MAAGEETGHFDKSRDNKEAEELDVKVPKSFEMHRSNIHEVDVFEAFGKADNEQRSFELALKQAEETQTQAPLRPAPDIREFRLGGAQLVLVHHLPTGTTSTKIHHQRLANVAIKLVKEGGTILHVCFSSSRPLPSLF